MFPKFFVLMDMEIIFFEHQFVIMHMHNKGDFQCKALIVPNSLLDPMSLIIPCCLGLTSHIQRFNSRSLLGEVQMLLFGCECHGP